LLILPAHICSPCHTRPIEVFIRHLHHTIPAEDIVTAPRVMDFSVTSVLSIRHRVSKEVLTLFTVVLDPNEFNQSVHQPPSLLNSRTMVENPHHARFPPQCKRGHRYTPTVINRQYVSNSATNILPSTSSDHQNYSGRKQSLWRCREL
jgi:hypothetical protein